MPTAAQCFAASQPLLPAAQLTLTNPLVYLNAHARGADAYARWLHRVNAASDWTAAPVLLGQYPPGAWLDPPRGFRLLTEAGSVAEQAGLGTDEDAGRASEAIPVDGPHLLACHPGAWCWGHWLLDSLPKIVLAERRAPGHFTFAVPAGLIDQEAAARGPGYARSVLQSLAAYGIGPERCLPIRHDQAYRFAALSDVAGVSGKLLHPGIHAALQSLRGAPDPPRRALTAILRAPPSDRVLANRPGILAALTAAGATFLDPLQASFADQVGAVRASDVIAGDLGSSLAGLIYARAGAGVVSLAPLHWDDDYFARLFQRLDLVVADVRGLSTAPPGDGVAKADYVVAPCDVLAGLHAVRAARAAPAEACLVQDRIVVRCPGAVLLELDFTTGGNAAGFARAGFAAPEPAGTWTLGARSHVLIPPARVPQGAKWLELEVSSFLHRPHLVSHPLAVDLDGVRAASLAIDETVCLHARLPPGWGGRIDLAHPVCPSPRTVSGAADDRPLGVMVHAIRLRQ